MSNFTPESGIEQTPPEGGTASLESITITESMEELEAKNAELEGRVKYARLQKQIADQELELRELRNPRASDSSPDFRRGELFGGAYASHGTDYRRPCSCFILFT